MLVITKDNTFWTYHIAWHCLRKKWKPQYALLSLLGLHAVLCTTEIHLSFHLVSAHRCGVNSLGVDQGDAIPIHFPLGKPLLYLIFALFT